jgi:hypothetical protein
MCRGVMQCASSLNMITIRALHCQTVVLRNVLQVGALVTGAPDLAGYSLIRK